MFPRTPDAALSWTKPKQVREPCLSAKEVFEMFGYKNANSLVCAANQGAFPAPDLVSGDKLKKLYWKRSTLAHEAARRGFKLGEEPKHPKRRTPCLN